MSDKQSKSQTFRTDVLPFFTGKMVTLVIPNSAVDDVSLDPLRRYQVHSDLLQKCSQVMFKHINNDMKEGITSEIVVKEVTVTTMDAFIEWLYTGDFDRTVKMWPQRMHQVPPPPVLHASTPGAPSRPAKRARREFEDGETLIRGGSNLLTSINLGFPTGMTHFTGEDDFPRLTRTNPPPSRNAGALTTPLQAPTPTTTTTTVSTHPKPTPATQYTPAGDLTPLLRMYFFADRFQIHDFALVVFEKLIYHRAWAEMFHCRALYTDYNPPVLLDVAELVKVMKLVAENLPANLARKEPLSLRHWCARLFAWVLPCEDEGTWKVFRDFLDEDESDFAKEIVLAGEHSDHVRKTTPFIGLLKTQ